MNTQYVRYEERDWVAWVTLNRPDVMNALHPPAEAELDAIWADYTHDVELWVAILSGAGERAFCAGADLKYRVTDADEGALRRPLLGRRMRLEQCCKLLPASERWAAEVMACAPLAVQAAKQVVANTADLPLEAALGRIERLEAVRRLRESEDYAEGPRAFAERRKPAWKGR